MLKPRALVLRAPGINCDRETVFAFEKAGAEVELTHVSRILEETTKLRDYQILCLPGGFSYGDDIAAGRILGNLLRHHLAEAMHEFRESGKLVIGICNGFQTMIKSGLFDGPNGNGQQATLTWNKSGKFEDRWVHLRTDGEKCVFLRGIESMYLPIAHAEGQFVTRDLETLKQLDSAGQLALRYASSSPSDAQLEYPHNPNGSMGEVAGMCDPSGRVFGLMPHPERHLDPTHHPHWTRRPRGQQPAAGDGLKIFTNAVEFFR